MAKLVLTDITSGYASTTALNANNALIEAALENTLSRDGTTPNTMSADLDMSGKSILNVGDMLIGGVGLTASVTAAAASATDADSSATAASNSAADSAASAAASATSATNAATSASVVADWDYLGAWTTETAYLVNNIIYESTEGASYICLIDHTSGTFSTDLETGKWGLLATRGAAGAGTGDMLKSENLSGLADYAIARSNMGLSIGVNVQAYDAQLTDIAALAVTDGNIIVGNGSAWVAESGATARESLGLPALLNQNYGSDGVTKITTNTTVGADFNTHTAAGVYNFDATNSANAPVTGLAWIFLEVFRHGNLAAGSEYTVQIAHDMNAGTRPRSWTRRQVAGSWSAWVETTLPAATASVNGYMTSAYASKLDGIEAGANVGITSDVGVNGVGMFATMANNTGGDIVSGATAAGSGLFVVLTGAATITSPSGTWRNVSGVSVPHTEITVFQRIS